MTNWKDTIILISMMKKLLLACISVCVSLVFYTQGQASCPTGGSQDETTRGTSRNAPASVQSEVQNLVIDIMQIEIQRPNLVGLLVKYPLDVEYLNMCSVYLMTSSFEYKMLQERAAEILSRVPSNETKGLLELFIKFHKADEDLTILFAKLKKDPTNLIPLATELPLLSQRYSDLSKQAASVLQKVLH